MVVCLLVCLIPIIPELVLIILELILIIPLISSLKPRISNIIAIDYMTHPNFIILKDINTIRMLISRNSGPT